MNILVNRMRLISIGMAMFAMFFGAGNIVFSLTIGQMTQDKALFALLGLVITGVGVPFAGLLSSTLFDGNYRAFFDRLGKTPGFFIALLIIALLGPLGCLPRCIALSYSTVKMFFPQTALVPFSLIGCALIFALTISKNRILDILGWVLSPFKILALVSIIVVGLWFHPEMSANTDHNGMTAFVYGIKSGYMTMDLLGAFFFGAVIIRSLKQLSLKEGVIDSKMLIRNSLYASGVGALLLAGIYIGMGLVAASHSSSLIGTTPDVVLGTIVLNVLGPYAGIVTCFAIVVACLTTSIALTSMFAEFLQRDILSDRINYVTALVVTLTITFLISCLEFNGILKFLGPVVEFLYPALIVLCFANMAYKLWGFTSIKTPFAIAVLTSLGLALFV